MFLKRAGIVADTPCCERRTFYIHLVDPEVCRCDDTGRILHFDIACNEHENLVWSLWRQNVRLVYDILYGSWLAQLLVRLMVHLSVGWFVDFVLLVDSLVVWLVCSFVGSLFRWLVLLFIHLFVG